jgi:hypothetical protein
MTALSVHGGSDYVFHAALNGFPLQFYPLEALGRVLEPNMLNAMGPA